MSISNRPWSNYAASDYSTAGVYCDACLINLNTGARDQWGKAQCKLPVYEPNGALNRNGVHAAASVLAGGRGGVDALPDARRRAARKLLTLYRELDETAPDTISRMAQ